MGEPGNSGCLQLMDVNHTRGKRALCCGTYSFSLTLLFLPPSLSLCQLLLLCFCFFLRSFLPVYWGCLSHLPGQTGQAGFFRIKAPLLGPSCKYLPSYPGIPHEENYFSLCGESLSMRLASTTNLHGLFLLQLLFCLSPLLFLALLMFSGNSLLVTQEGEME